MEVLAVVDEDMINEILDAYFTERGFDSVAVDINGSVDIVARLRANDIKAVNGGDR